MVDDLIYLYGGMIGYAVELLALLIIVHGHAWRLVRRRP